MKNVIYYFTGTGNSMRAAMVIAEQLRNTEIVSMRNKAAEVPAVDADMVGFIFPVYHWTLPESVIRFVQQLKINPNAYIFAVSMPAMINGNCMEVLAELLKEKGCQLSYGEKVYSVANYVVMYPPFQNPKFRVPKTEKKLAAIAHDVIAKKEKEFPRANAYVRRNFHRKMDRFIAHCPGNDKYFSVWDDCVSCGLCAKVCPSHNITMVDGKPVFLHQCSQCMACISFCPKQAINAPRYTRKRKKYHNPHVSARDIIEDRRYYN